MKAIKRHALLYACIAFFITACGGEAGKTAKGPEPVQGDGPIVNIVNPIKRTLGKGQVTLSGTAEDADRVQKVRWSNKTTGEAGDANGTYDWYTNPITLKEGSNTITVYADNPQSLSGQSSIIVTYVANDTETPQVTIETPQDNEQTTLTAIDLTVSASDNLDIAKVEWTRTAPAGASGTAVKSGEVWLIRDIALAVNQTNTIRVTAYDEADLSSYKTINVIQSQGNLDNLGYQSESCMNCHNGSDQDNYGDADGLQNPHPFPGAPYVKCSTCHGGDPTHPNGPQGAHVPPPPSLTFNANGANDIAQVKAWWNRVTLDGVDKYGDFADADGNYQVDGKDYNILDYLQFINPGDLRVVGANRGCGSAGCHGAQHGLWVPRSLIATESGLFSGAMFAAGLPNQLGDTNYEDTAADLGFRGIQSIVPDNYVENPPRVGAVKSLKMYPVYSEIDTNAGNGLSDASQLVDIQAADLVNDVYAAAENINKVNQLKPNSDLAKLYHEQVAFTCGDCHAGSRGANNRYGDFRSSGCTACHMTYAQDGVTKAADAIRNPGGNNPVGQLLAFQVNLDPNVNNEQIVFPQVPRIEKHLIKNVYKNTTIGQKVSGITDATCPGCHQGSNRNVLQYWGIRLDQNQDVANNRQYPANPATFVNTANNARLYDPNVGNQRFNGRVANQYLEYEDYDGDAFDDTPMDVHAEAGLGCIDCHGSRDLHGGTKNDKGSGEIMSRMEQGIGVTCTNCHGNVDSYAASVDCIDYQNKSAKCAVDRFGNPLKHVTQNGLGEVYLVSKVDGRSHFVPQTKDTVVDTKKSFPSGVAYRTGVNKVNQPIYSVKASYSMGRFHQGDSAANDPDGLGPRQQNLAVREGFSHTDKIECVACHASWTNNCLGCHLAGQYVKYDGNVNNAFFSNINGRQIAYKQTAADFVYISPIPFTLGISTKNTISGFAPGEQVFYRYIDSAGTESQVFAFSDRKGNGNNPNIIGANALQSLGHNTLMQHSIRGQIETKNIAANVQIKDEGPRYCVACHLTTDGLTAFGGGNLNAGITAYNLFKTTMANLQANFAQLNNADFANNFPVVAGTGQTLFQLLQKDIGQNTGNQNNSPLFIHMVAGLGTGLFVFDQAGCPINGLDNVPHAVRTNNAINCPDAPNANNNAPVYDLDRIVEATGVENSSSTHPIQSGVASDNRTGTRYPKISGPLGGELIRRLSEADVNKGGIVLDSYYDADGTPHGLAPQ